MPAGCPAGVSFPPVVRNGIAGAGKPFLVTTELFQRFRGKELRAIAGGMAASSCCESPMDMLYARRSPAQETDAEVAAGAAKDDIAITPLGVPVLAGPGAISTVLILLNQANGVGQVVVLFASIGLVCFVSYWVFWLAVGG